MRGSAPASDGGLSAEECEPIDERPFKIDSLNRLVSVSQTLCRLLQKMAGRNVVDELMCKFLDKDVRRQITNVNVQDHKDELCSCGYGSVTTGSVVMTDGNTYDFRAVGRCLSPGVYDDSFDLLNFPNQSPEIQEALQLISNLTDDGRRCLKDTLEFTNQLSDLQDALQLISNLSEDDRSKLEANLRWNTPVGLYCNF